MNDNEQFLLASADGTETTLVVTKLSGSGRVSLEVHSTCGERSFMLDQAAIKSMATLLNQFKGH